MTADNCLTGETMNKRLLFILAALVLPACIQQPAPVIAVTVIAPTATIAPEPTSTPRTLSDEFAFVDHWSKRGFSPGTSPGYQVALFQSTGSLFLVAAWNSETHTYRANYRIADETSEMNLRRVEFFEQALLFTSPDYSGQMAEIIGRTIADFINSTGTRIVRMVRVGPYSVDYVIERSEGRISMTLEIGVP